MGLGLLAVVGCGSKSSTPDASSSQSLPTPSCGGTANVTGTTPAGYFAGDTVTVDVTLGASTSVAVFVAESGSSEVLSWTTSWPAADGGVATLVPIDETNDATFTYPVSPGVAAIMVPGTVDVLSATNPAAVSAAGHGGQIKVSVAFSTSTLQLSGTIISPYCQITSGTTTSP